MESLFAWRCLKQNVHAWCKMMSCQIPFYDMTMLWFVQHSGFFQVKVLNPPRAGKKLLVPATLFTTFHKCISDVLWHAPRVHPMYAVSADQTQFVSSCPIWLLGSLEGMFELLNSISRFATLWMCCFREARWQVPIVSRLFSVRLFPAASSSLHYDVPRFSLGAKLHLILFRF